MKYRARSAVSLFALAALLGSASADEFGPGYGHENDTCERIWSMQSRVPARGYFCSAQEKTDAIAAATDDIYNAGKVIEGCRFLIEEQRDIIARARDLPDPDSQVARLVEATELIERHTALRDEAQRDQPVLIAERDKLDALEVRDCGPEPVKETGAVGGGTTSSEPGEPLKGWAEVAGAFIRLPHQSFFGSEAPGDTRPTLGLFDSDRTIEVVRYGAGLSIPLDDRFGASVSVSGYEGDSLVRYPRTDLAGRRFLLPGLGLAGDPNANGYSFGYFNGLNTPVDVGISRHVDTFTIEVDVFYGITDEIELGAGYGFSLNEFEVRGVGLLPGFAREFTLVQLIEGTTHSLGIYVAGEVPINETIRIGVRAEAAVVFTDYSGTNQLGLTGFPTQVAEEAIDEQGETFNMSLYLETDVSSTASIVITGDYFASNNTSPVFETPGGGERTRIVAEDESGWEIGVVAKLTFGGN